MSDSSWRRGQRSSGEPRCWSASTSLSQLSKNQQLEPSPLTLIHEVLMDGKFQPQGGVKVADLVVISSIPQYPADAETLDLVQKQLFAHQVGLR